MGIDVAIFFLVPTMQICCRAPWELEEARRHPPATLVQWNWVPKVWQSVDLWPPRARRLGQLVLGKVDFHFDRSRDFDFGGAIAALRAAGLPRPDALLVGHHATRAACFELPEQRILHADVNRPQPFVSYLERHGVPVTDTLRVPDAIRWLWLEGDPAVLGFEGSGTSHRRSTARWHVASLSTTSGRTHYGASTHRIRSPDVHRPDCGSCAAHRIHDASAVEGPQSRVQLTARVPTGGQRSPSNCRTYAAPHSTPTKCRGADEDVVDSRVQCLLARHREHAGPKAQSQIIGRSSHPSTARMTASCVSA